MLASCGEPSQVRWDPIPIGMPPDLEQQIDSGVPFDDLQAAPDTYVGWMVKLGGLMILAKRTSDHTELEVLELPIEAAGVPATDRLRSRGRFLALRKAFPDPPTVPAGTPITVIGVVKEATTRPLDESEYCYPVVEITHLIDWNAVIRGGVGERNWVMVERDYLSSGAQTVYIDPDTIRGEGTRVTVWQLTDYKMMQGNVGFAGGSHRFFSTNTQKQFDCMNKRVRLLAFEEFSGHMGIGRRDGGYVDQDKWLAVEPESVNQAVWELVCATPAEPAP